MRSSEKKVTAFAGAGEQQQALDAWRAKTAERAARVDGITKKISTHKQQAQQTAKRARWLADRDALNKEQDACEEQLTVSLHPLLSSLQESVVEGAAATRVLRDEVKEQLTRIRGCAQALSQPGASFAASKRRDALDGMQQRLTSFRVFLAQARNDLEKEEEEEGEAEQSQPSLSTSSCVSVGETTVDFAELFAATRQRCIALRSMYPENECLAVHDAFQQAFLFEQERCEARLGELASSRPLPNLANHPCVSPQVLGSVALILKMANNARRGDAAASSSREVVDRVRLAFPKLSRQDIGVAVEECQRRRSTQQRERLVALDYKKATAALFSTLAASLEAQRQAAAMEKEKAEERLQWEVKQADRHQHLAEQRVAYEALQRMRQADEERAAAEAQKKLDAAQAVHMRQLQERLQRLAEFMKSRDEARQREAELAALRESELAEQRAMEAEANRQRVVFRQQEYEEKQCQRAAKEQEVRLSQEAKSAALARFFASVEKQLDVHPSRERLLQATEARKQTNEYVPLAQAMYATGAAPGGFTDDQIMKDPRVRLYHALLEAGLHKTEYGREVASRGFRVAPAQRMSEDNPFS